MRKSLLLLLSFLGLFDSLYLLWVYTSPSRPMVCIGSGCDVVRASPFAHFWGVPVPAFGVAMYGLLALLVFAQPLSPTRLARGMQFALFAMSGLGFLSSVFLTCIEALVLHAWCAWCVVSALAVSFIFLLATLEAAWPGPPASPLALLRAVRTNLALSAVAVIIGVPAFFWLSRHGEPSPLEQASHQLLDQRLVRPDSHMTGNPEAGVTVVEFGDFECPACGTEQPTVRELRQKYGDRIRFVFRQFPLISIHPQAEKAAEASECAAEQGKFWEAVDKLYAEQNDLSEPALLRDAADLGLDLNRFSGCLKSGAMAARVHRDMEDARALHVDRTPTFFVDDRAMAGPVPLDQFTQVIDLELRSRGPLAQTRRRETARLDAQGATPAQPQTSGASEPATDPSAASGSTGLPGLSADSSFTQFQIPGSGCSEEEAKKRQPALISTGEARQLFHNGSSALFVDVRPPQDFRSRRIRGAVNMPADEMPRRWSALPKDRTIVFYESGRSAGDVCAAGRGAGRILLEHGFSPEQVKVYQDGLAGWEKAGLPLAR